MSRTQTWFRKSLGLILVGSLFALGATGYASENGETAPATESEPLSLSACDQFMEEYTRSSARKIARGLGRGNYNLRALELVSPVTMSGITAEMLEFEVFSEADGRVVGLVDRKREWPKTYLVTMTSIGPIVVSQTWQSRRLRNAGQPCAPITSELEWPRTTANTVDIEPFRYWGLRVSWRIPPVDRAEVDPRTVEEVLDEILRRQMQE